MPFVTGNIASWSRNDGPMDRSAAVAVLTWRGEDITKNCLESLQVLSQWPSGIVVVDNASGTDEGRRLAAEFGVEALTLPRNEAVAGGYNAAIDWAARRGYTHVLLLNNDTTVAVDIVRPLVDAADEGVAAVGPVVLNDDGSVSTAGGQLWMWAGHARARRAPAAAQPYDVDWIDGSAMLVSVSAASAVGGLSPDFHMYWEEADWCTRARRAGYRIVVQPGAAIRHTRGATVGGLAMRVWSLRSALLFLRRNASVIELITALPAYAALRVPVYLARVARVHGARAAIEGLRRSVMWNIRDAVRRGIRVPADGPTIAGNAAAEPYRRRA